jgi:hypothetical protein
MTGLTAGFQHLTSITYSHKPRSSLKLRAFKMIVSGTELSASVSSETLWVFR